MTPKRRETVSLISKGSLQQSPRSPAFWESCAEGETVTARAGALSINQPTACPTPAGNWAHIHFSHTRGFH